MHLIIYFSLTYKFTWYHRWSFLNYRMNMQKQSSRGVLFKEIQKTKNKNFEKIVGEHPRQSLPHNKAAGLSPARYQKRDFGRGTLPWILQNPQEHARSQNTSSGCFKTDQISAKHLNKIEDQRPVIAPFECKKRWHGAPQLILID